MPLNPQIPLMGRNPGIASGFSQGLLSGMKVRQARNQEQSQKALRELVQDYAGGDKSALTKIAGYDPQTYAALASVEEKRNASAQEQAKQQMQRAGRAVGIYGQIINQDPAAGMSYWPRIRETLLESGVYTEDELPAAPPNQQWVMAEAADYENAMSQLESVLNPEYGSVQKGMVGGEPGFFQVGPRGQVRTIEGVTPEPDKADRDTTDTTKLRGEFQKQTKDFRQVRDAYTKVQKAAEKPSAAGDLSLIFNYMKMLDPGSVVREGEFATAQNAAGVPQRIRNMYNRVMTGERLADDQRQDFVFQAGQVYDSQLDTAQKTEQSYRRLAREYNLDPARVIDDYRAGVDPAAAPDEEQEQPARPEGPIEREATLGDKPYVKIDGQWWPK